MNGAPKTPPFDPSSRYYAIEIAEITVADGRTMRYVRRRFISQPSQFETLTEHTVTQGDRIDTIAARYLGDPQQYWRVCDANVVIRPDTLTEVPGRGVRITLPEGVPGVKRE
ncbi:MAG: LysM domain-containing protein [Acidobacteriota bacterium]|nr:LysM domain-containing protein [Acidobacteriota bacterium]